MSRRTVIILVLATIFFHGWPAYRHFVNRPTDPRAFEIEPVITSDPSPQFFSEFLPKSPNSLSVHVASLCELPAGGLGAVWYGGQSELAEDMAIYFVRSSPEARDPWSSPKAIVDRESASRELGRFVKSVGNPVLFSDARRLWLIFVTIPMGGWSMSSLNVKTSDDGGLTWGRSRRLVLSPFFNISELVRARPLPLKDGGVGLPIYHEFLGKFPEMLWIRMDEGTQDYRYGKTRIMGGRSYIQPSVVAFGPQFAAAFFRDCSEAKVMAMAVTHDAGETWSEIRALDLPNPDSGLDTLLLSRGEILLAFNDQKYGRDTLRLGLSKDRGIHWDRVATLDHSPQKELSYPFMISGKDGLIHLVYTWQREYIRHVRFNEAWIHAQMQGAATR